MRKIVLVATAVAMIPLTSALAQQNASQAYGRTGQEPRSGQEQAGVGAPLYVGPSIVRQIQQNLTHSGFDIGQADGEWGAQTSTALRNFQRQRGLEPTGNINLETLEALNIPLTGRGGAGLASTQQGQYGRGQQFGQRGAYSTQQYGQGSYGGQGSYPQQGRYSQQGGQTSEHGQGGSSGGVGGVGAGVGAGAGSGR